MKKLLVLMLVLTFLTCYENPDYLQISCGTVLSKRTAPIAKSLEIKNERTGDTLNIVFADSIVNSVKIGERFCHERIGKFFAE